MPIRHLFVLLLLLALFWGCEKEPLAPGDAAPGSALIGERSGPSQAEIQETLAAIDSIKSFKEQIDRWRDGQELSKSVNAEQAAELVETAINFYISKPGQAYEDYTTVVDSVSVPTSSSTWSGAQIAAFFNAMKGRLVHHFGQVSGTDKAYQFVDMGAPVVDGGSSKVYFFATIGRGQVEAPPQQTVLEIRWAEQLTGPPNLPGQFGFTVTECEGSATTEIAKSVNASLGLFLKNLAPAPINPNNPNTDPQAFIISPVRNVLTNFLGSNEILGNSPPPVFTVSTFYQTPSFAFPFLVNSTAGGNVFPEYPVRGQFKIHADFEFGPNLPDENCFSISKLGAYAISNREVGDFYTDEVNARLGPFPFPSIFNRQLISTFVVPLALAGETGLDVPAFRQEHVTWHFYAAVLRFVFEEELCCPALL